MSNDQNQSPPEGGVALATQGELKRQIEQHPHYQQNLLIREAAKSISNTSWGKALTPAERSAIATYALELDVDPTKLTLFGGQPYMGADIYFDKFHSAWPSGAMEQPNITDDIEARRQWGVPECATAAYLTHLWKDGQRRDAGLQPDVVEVGYAPKTLAKSKKPPFKGLDEVGVAEPHKTARTRSARRAMRAVTPIWSQRAEAIERKILMLHAQAKQSMAVERPAELAYGSPSLPEDPYAAQVGPGTNPEPPISVSLADDIRTLMQDERFTKEEREGTLNFLDNADYSEEDLASLYTDLTAVLEDKDAGAE